MADKKLSLIVELINKTEGEFKTISKNLEEVKKSHENMNAVMKKVAVASTAAFAAIAGGAYMMISSAAEAEAEMAKFNTTMDNMGAAGKAAKAALLETAAAAVKLGFDDEEAANVLAKLYQRTKDVASAQQLFQLTADLARAKNLELTQASNLVTQAMSGNGRVFMQYGIAIKDTASPLEAFRILQEKVGGQAGAFAQTFAGQMSILTQESNNLKEAIGAALLPAVTQLLQQITPVITRFAQWAEKNPETIVTIVKVGLAITGLIAVTSTLGVLISSATMVFTAFTAANTILGTVIRASATAGVAIFTGQVTLSSVATSIATVATSAWSVALGVLRTVMLAIPLLAIAAAVIYVGKTFYDLAQQVGGFGNAFRYIWLQIKKVFFDTLESIVGGLESLLNMIPGLNVSFSDIVSGLRIMSAEADAQMTVLATSTLVPGEAAQTTADKVMSATGSITGNFGQWGGAAKDASDAAKKNMEDLTNSVKAVRDEIKKTYDDIKQATADYLKSVGNENKSYEQQVVETVAGAQKKKLDLEVELRQAQATGSYDQITQLGKQIQEQSAIITTYGTMQMDLDRQIATERERLQMNELQRLNFDHQTKLNNMQMEFVAEQAARMQRIVELQAEQAQILALVGKDKAAKIEAELAKAKSTRERLADEKKGLSTWIDETKVMYQDYVNSINGILATIKQPSGGGMFNAQMNVFSSSVAGKRASGGTVQPGRTYLVGERGPELFTAQEYGRISNGSAGGLTIVITGNSFVGQEDVARQISRDIMTELKQNVKL